MARIDSRAPFLGAVAVLAAAIIAVSCSTPFVMDASSLKGRTITYFGSNGKDTDTFAFSADGLSGTWEQKFYYFGYPTAAAEDAGDYTGKAWYQIGGLKASFTYNPDTFDIVITMLEYYEQTPAAASAHTYFAADFAYQSLKDVFSEYSDDDDYAAYAIVRTTKAIFTQDNCSLIESQSLARAPIGHSSEFLSSPVFGSAGTWTHSDVSAHTFTLSTGESGTSTYTKSTSLTLGSSALSLSTEQSYVDTIGSAEPTRQTIKTIMECGVDAARLVGSTEEDETFAEIWEDGNIVSLDLTRTRIEEMEYFGADAPTAPAMEADGDALASGSNAAGPYFYSISVVPTALRVSLAKSERYVSGTDFVTAASRDF